MAEVLVEFTEPIPSDEGRSYVARACAAEMAGGLWQGWIEFVPVGDGDAVRTGRETTQPNREDTEYWATGLTPVYLEGALRRARQPLVRPPARPLPAALFNEPAPAVVETDDTGVDTALNPFSIYRKGEALLRRQLAALSGWHLVNIVRGYELDVRDPAVLAALEPSELVELIIDRVRRRAH